MSGAPQPVRRYTARTREEVAGVVFQLCGTDFGYVTGTEIFLTGGQHLF